MTSWKLVSTCPLKQIYKPCFEMPQNSAMRLHKVQYKNWHDSSERLQDLHMCHRKPITGLIPDWKINKSQNMWKEIFMTSFFLFLYTENLGPQKYTQIIQINRSVKPLKTLESWQKDHKLCMHSIPLQDCLSRELLTWKMGWARRPPNDRCRSRGGTLFNTPDVTHSNTFSICSLSWSLKVMWMNNTLFNTPNVTQCHGHWKWCEWILHFSTCLMSHTVSWLLKVMWMNNTLFNMPHVTHSNTFSICSLSWSLKVMWMNNTLFNTPNVTHSVMVIESDMNEH